MVLPSKTRLGKRKLEVKEVRKEKQVIASKKHDKKCFPEIGISSKEETRKPLLKSDLLDKMDLTEQLNDALLEEVKNNEKAIQILEDKEKKYVERIKILEERVEFLKKKSSPESFSDFGMQTSKDAGDFEPQIPCQICIYVATCEEQLNWHMENDHDITTDLQYETDFPCGICGKWCRSEADLTYHLKKHELDSLTCKSKSLNNESEMLTCNFCDGKFATKRELMLHKKKVHSEKVRICWNNSNRECEFGDNACWFLHTKTSNSDQVDCTICGQVFPNINHLLNHKKKNHIESVQHCKNDLSSSCKYGYQNCWYKHNIPTDNELNNVNQEVIEKLFKMMEQFTERIVHLENQTNSQ